jgi:hypothetical protein
LTFKGLNKVDMGTSGFDGDENIGGPVHYVLKQAGQKTVTSAMGHITWFDNSDPNHKLLYYTPIDEVLSTISENNNCPYNLLTYEGQQSTNDKEFQAQVEIPPKK